MTEDTVISVFSGCVAGTRLRTGAVDDAFVESDGNDVFLVVYGVKTRLSRPWQKTFDS